MRSFIDITKAYFGCYSTFLHDIKDDLTSGIKWEVNSNRSCPRRPTLEFRWHQRER